MKIGIQGFLYLFGRPLRAHVSLKGINRISVRPVKFRMVKFYFRVVTPRYMDRGGNLRRID